MATSSYRGTFYRIMSLEFSIHEQTNFTKHPLDGTLLLYPRLSLWHSSLEGVIVFSESWSLMKTKICVNSKNPLTM